MKPLSCKLYEDKDVQYVTEDRNETLYFCGKTGQYFLRGTNGKHEDYRWACGQEPLCKDCNGGEEIHPLTSTEANQWLIDHWRI